MRRRKGGVLDLMGKLANREASSDIVGHLELLVACVWSLESIYLSCGNVLSLALICRFK